VLLVGQKVLSINHETFYKLGINPQEAVDYILSKKARHIRPIHVKALEVLRKPYVHSS